MTSPMIIWYLLAAVVLCASLLHLLRYLKTHGHSNHFRILSRFKEEEILYLPGDKQSDEYPDAD